MIRKKSLFDINLYFELRFSDSITIRAQKHKQIKQIHCYIDRESRYRFLIKQYKVHAEQKYGNHSSK